MRRSTVFIYTQAAHVLVFSMASVCSKCCFILYMCCATHFNRFFMRSIFLKLVRQNRNFIGFLQLFVKMTAQWFQFYKKKKDFKVFPVLCSRMLHIVRDYILRLSALAAFLNLLSKCFVNTVKSRCWVSFQQFSYSLSVKHQSSATQKLTVVDNKVIFCHFWHEQTDPYFHSLFGPQPLSFSSEMSFSSLLWENTKTQHK